MQRLRTGASVLAFAGALVLLSAAPGTATPGADPTPSPTPSAAATPSSSCADPTPGASPSPSPSPAPSPDPAADACAGDDSLAETTAAVLAAQAELESAQADLARAQQALQTAQARVTAAQARHDAAVQALRRARATEQKIEGEIADLQRSVSGTHQDLGEVASAAYRNGPFHSVEVVLSAGTPAEFTDRINQYQSVMRAEDTALAQMADADADLANRRAQLVAQRELSESLETQARLQLAAARSAALAASDAQAALDGVVAQREEALAAAREARAEDVRRYQSMIATSGALGSRLVTLSQQLQAGHGAVQGTLEFARPGTGPETSPFGMRYHPILHYVKLHTGEDLGVGDGYVYAADDGVVVVSELNTAYGNMTIIDHGLLGKDPLDTMYAHQSVVLVHPGDKVHKGQLIGVIGATGYATGPHLHFEVRVAGAPVDPAPWLVDAPLPTDVQAVRTPVASRSSTAVPTHTR